jgi:hypothetical protein
MYLFCSRNLRRERELFSQKFRKPPRIGGKIMMLSLNPPRGLQKFGAGTLKKWENIT